jgi:hypothetical protein|tara:strand:- start:49 stop:294 length:246 start_codon:yes stop_codon:yes gene_type:complete
MNFEDDCNLVYEEFVYLDLIKFTGINGVIATAHYPSVAKAIRVHLLSDGFRVVRHKPDSDGDKKPIQYTANSGSCMMPEGR